MQFDGWSQRHATMPFIGQRYSLVWFTPQNINKEDMYWTEEVELLFTDYANNELNERTQNVSL